MCFFMEIFMTNAYSFDLRERILIAPVPHGHWKTTFLAALRHDGLTAPMVVDGTINGELFLAYVE